MRQDDDEQYFNLWWPNIKIQTLLKDFLKDFDSNNIKID